MKNANEEKGIPLSNFNQFKGKTYCWSSRPDETKYKQQKFRKPRGQSLMEMALLLPFLLVLVISGIEMGRLFYTKIVITNSAREGAYYLVTHPTDYDQITGTAPNTVTAAEQEAGNSGISSVTVSFSPQNCCALGEYSMIVTVETEVDDLLILGFLEDILSITATKYDVFSLSSSVEMMVQ